ncbi:hypothetical protein GQ457_12G015580 [Hibiscus cannabinus]
MRSALQPIMKYDRSGVGYKHDSHQKMKQILKKREQRRAKLIGRRGNRKESVKDSPMSTRVVLNNWTVVELPVVFRILKE